MSTRALVLVVLSSVASAQTFGPDFVTDYTYVDLGTPAGLTPGLGGVNFKSGNNNVLLIAGHAYQATGDIWEVPITRDTSGHINGYAGGESLHATAPYIDGCLSRGPGGVMFYTSYPVNILGQIKPGSTAPDRQDVLTLMSGVTSSMGGGGFVPAGFPGAGKLKVTSYTSDEWYELPLTPDANGTYIPGTAILRTALHGTGYGGPEGAIWVHGGAPGFAVDSVVVSEHAEWQVAAYDCDGNGDPIAASRRVLLDNLVHADGAAIDPVTGDFVFTTQGGGDRVVVVRRNTVSTYCTAGTTSNGCVASISGTGAPSATAGSGFTITASALEGQKQGILFYGINGRLAQPWAVGSSSLLCVKSPSQRMGAQSSGGTTGACDGTLSVDWCQFIASHPTALGNPFTAGNIVQAQGWFRDPPSPKTTSLTNAVEFVVQP